MRFLGTPAARLAESQPVPRILAGLWLLGEEADEISCFSAVYHEVIWGHLSELRECAGLLNERLLLPTMDAMKEIQRVRNRLLEFEADVETCGQCEPIAVFGPAITTTL